MIYEYKGVKPRLGKNVFLAPGTIILGDVEIGDNTNIWFYTVARGDVNHIRIGADTNIQDLCMLHVTSVKYPLTIGDRVIIGHRVVVHGCTINDDALIGIGALVLDGAVVEPGAIVAAGAVVPPNALIPEGMVAAGVPAKPIRKVSQEEKNFNITNSLKYKNYAGNFNNLARPV